MLGYYRMNNKFMDFVCSGHPPYWPGSCTWGVTLHTVVLMTVCTSIAISWWTSQTFPNRPYTPESSPLASLHAKEVLVRSLITFTAQFVARIHITLSNRSPKRSPSPLTTLLQKNSGNKPLKKPWWQLNVHFPIPTSFYFCLPRVTLSSLTDVTFGLKPNRNTINPSQAH